MTKQKAETLNLKEWRFTWLSGLGMSPCVLAPLLWASWDASSASWERVVQGAAQDGCQNTAAEMGGC